MTLAHGYARLANAANVYESLARSASSAKNSFATAATLAGADSLSDSPAYRVSQSVASRSAWLQFARAQQATFVARRAVEVYLGENMEAMAVTEPFVLAPASWMNDLFSAADRTEGSPPVNVAPEELSDYSTRIDDFLRGYSIKRRLRSASDVAVLDLGSIHDASNEGTRPFYSTLMYKCRNVVTPLLGGAEDGLPTTTPCAGALGGVEEARFEFAISTGQSTYSGSRLSAGNFNYRHVAFGVNVVGVGVRNCMNADRPWECAADGNVPYYLRQDAIGQVENFGGDTLGFDFGAGTTSSARALVADRALTNPVSSGDRQLFVPYMRFELRSRPIRSVHTLVIPSRPEIVWSRIETIQLLLEYSYWTRQQ